MTDLLEGRSTPKVPRSTGEEEVAQLKEHFERILLLLCSSIERDLQGRPELSNKYR
jgi:hypothetical protein